MIFANNILYFVVLLASVFASYSGALAEHVQVEDRQMRLETELAGVKIRIDKIDEDISSIKNTLKMVVQTVRS